MGSYEVNKGIGSSAEFKGLKAQYLFLFAGGILLSFFVVILFFVFGGNQFIGILLGLSLGGVSTWLTFYLNRRYGEHGLMKRHALSRHPRYIMRRHTARVLLRSSSREGQFSNVL